MKKLLLYALSIALMILFSLNNASIARKSPNLYDGRLRWLFTEGDLDYYIDMDLTHISGNEDIKDWVQVEQIYYKDKVIAETYYNFYWDGKFNASLWNEGGIIPIQSPPKIFDGGVDIDYTLHNDPRIIEILTWRGITYSVKASTLKYKFNNLADIDYFECNISADNNSPQNFYFQKRNGKVEVHIRNQYNAEIYPDFAESLYKKICDSVIRTTWQEKFPKSYASEKFAKN